MTPRRTLLATLALPLLPRPARADAAALEPVRKLTDGLLVIMKAGKATPFAQRAASFRPVATAAFDLETILKASIGPRWNGIPDAAKADLLAAFTDYTIASWVGNFDNWNGERFEIAPDTRASGTDQIVQSKIVPKQGDPTRLDYVVRNAGGWRIVDVLFDGSISEVARQRADFRASVTRGEATLLEMLRKKTADLASGNK